MDTTEKLERLALGGMIDHVLYLFKMVRSGSREALETLKEAAVDLLDKFNDAKTQPLLRKLIRAEEAAFPAVLGRQIEFFQKLTKGGEIEKVELDREITFLEQIHSALEKEETGE